MRRWFGTALILLVLGALASSAVADDKPTIDTRQYPGAPVIVTDFTSYSTLRGFATMHVVCVSFIPVRALSAVKFAVASRDAQGKEYQRLTIERDGSFPARVAVKGHPESERANCRDMNIMRGDAPFVLVRLIAATYADGTTWTAPDTDLPPRATPAPATPSPVTGSPSPWSARAHTHYLAVAYGRAPSHVAIFAPGETAPAAVVEFSACCAAAVAFDATGALYVATTANGISVFPPGATAPARHLSGGGTALAIGPGGDVAAGGADRDRNVHVYPGAAEASAYAIPARVSAGGLAFAPNGDLAVADGGAAVSVYPHGATEASRITATPETNLVAYDAGGHLAAGSTSQAVVTVFAPEPNVKSVQIKGLRPYALAYDAAGELLVGLSDGVHPFTAGAMRPANRLLGAAANALATDPNGTIAAGDSERGVVMVYASRTQRTVLTGLDGVRSLAFSP